MSSQYHIRFYTPEDRQALEGLYHAVYGEAWRDHTRLGWYLDHPLAQAGSSVAVDGDVIVAAQPYCDFPLHTPWGAACASVFLDVATHPAHRRQGLFKRVVVAARTAAFERGVCLLLTTPNRTAFSGFQTMPEWVLLCALDCLLLPLGVGKRTNDGGIVSLGARGVLATASLLWHGPQAQTLRSVHAQYDIESPWSPGPEADVLWTDTAACPGIMVTRDRAFLQWRFDAGYRLFLGRNAKGPIGYAAARVITRAGLRIGMLLDCVTTGDKINALPLLADVLAWFKAEGTAVAMGYFLRHSTPWQQARAAGFLCLPRCLVPREYPVCASVRPEDPHSADLLNLSSWYMSLADSDLA
jgi:GNAT superfamily N-acetyltransferase